MNAGLVALIVVSGGIVGPLLLALLNSRQQARKEIRDNARQDLVAEKAERLRQEERQRQEAVATKAAEAAKLLLVQNAKVAAAAQATNEKLDVIHGLVNSTLTGAIEAQLEATIAQLGLMNQALSGNVQTPTPEAFADIRSRIADMRQALHDRAESVKEQTPQGGE